MADWLDEADDQPEAWGVGAVMIERRGSEVAVTTSGIDASGDPDGHAVLLTRWDALGLAWSLIRAAVIGR